MAKKAHEKRDLRKDRKDRNNRY